MSVLDLQQIRRADGACILSIEGGIDETTVGAFEQGLAKGLAGSHRLIVDLTSCSISADGVEALKRFALRAPGAAPVLLVAREPCLLRILDAVGLATVLGTHPTVNAALTCSTDQAQTGSRANRSTNDRRYPCMTNTEDPYIDLARHPDRSSRPHRSRRIPLQQTLETTHPVAPSRSDPATQKGPWPCSLSHSSEPAESLRF